MARKTVTYEDPEQMARKAYLLNRNGRWFYSRAYPKELWDMPGKRAPFRKSLRTDSLAEAQRARPEAERLFHKAVDDARLEKARTASAPPLTHPDAVALASDWFRKTLVEMEDWFLPKGPDRVHSDVRDADYGLGLDREQLAEGNLSKTIGQARDLAKAAGFRFDPECPEVKGLARLLLRGHVALGEVYRARLVSDYGARPSDPQFAALMEPIAAAQVVPVSTPSASARKPARTFADLERAFRADRVAGLSVAGKNAYGATFKFLRDMLGAEKPLPEIDREVGRELFEAAQKLPRGYGRIKALKDMKAPDAIAEGERLGLPKLAPKTINDTYLALSSAIFGWAVTEGWMTSNPVKGLRVREAVAAQDKRDPFTMKQLKDLFAGEPWSPPNPNTSGKPIRYWGPLLALFHGLRRGEIAQLKPQDVLQEEGHWIMEVRGERLKTPAARRTLPVHRELVRLGFTAYAESRAASEMLFEGEKANKNGQWGDALSDWFVRLLKERGITDGRRLGMHSFRHNFQDRLREAGLHGTPIGQKLAGRARGDVSDDYGRGFSIVALAEAMDKISYPGLHIGG